jgi:glucose-6-phosphate isomerase
MGVALTATPAWKELARHRDELKATSLHEVVLGDPARLAHCQIACEGLRFNYALNFVTPRTIELLAKLAAQEKLESWRARMFAGEKINTGENRAVLHTALRQKGDTPLMLDGRDVIRDVRSVHERMAKFALDVRAGKWTGATGKPIRHIVNIGIGGSDLGPRLAVEALALQASGPSVRFVANADVFELLPAIKNIDPAETLFLVVSKTFTTEEALLNARTARQWLIEKLGDKAVVRHFIAVSSNVGEAEAFGIAPANIFPMGDWVGGRFSLWSAVGLSVMLAIGPENFQRMCDGAFAMDEHFRTAPFAQNMPVLFGLLGVWQRNFLSSSARAVLPYSERLRDLPRYLQQLEMESNGKTVMRYGKPVDFATAPIIFGECGTVGQHSFHQWLHQGSDIAAADFIAVAEDDLGHAAHHKALLANMAAQATALAFGRTDAHEPQKIYAGGRPCNLLLLDRLDPYRFGLLIALYEHKIFVEGAIWGLNSFDQPGVELGKQLVRGLAAGTPPQGKDEAFLAELFRLASGSTKK